MSTWEQNLQRAEAEADRLAAARWDVDGFSLSRVMVIEEKKLGRPTSTVARGGNVLGANEFYEAALGQAMARRIAAEHNAMTDLLRAAGRLLARARREMADPQDVDEIYQVECAIAQAEAARKERPRR